MGCKGNFFHLLNSSPAPACGLRAVPGLHKFNTMNTLKAKAISEIRSTIATLSAHQHNEPNSEFADRIEGLQVLLGELEGAGWVEVTPETKPEPGKFYFALFKAINGKYIKCVATYTEGWDLIVESEGDEDHLNHDEVKELSYLPKGWYECCEQEGGSYDEMYFKRDVVFYLPNIELPQPPTK